MFSLCKLRGLNLLRLEQYNTQITPQCQDPAEKYPGFLAEARGAPEGREAGLPPATTDWPGPPSGRSAAVGRPSVAGPPSPGR